jgi:chemotaxis methyl-accepting protein methylase
MLTGEESLTGMSAVENARDARFRHIVFRSGHGFRPGGRSPLNLAPAPKPPVPPRLSLDPFFGPSRNAESDDVADPATPGGGLSAEQESFIDWLFARASLDARAYRPETLGRRLGACLRTVRAASIAQARDRLESEPGLTGAALGAMLIGVSGFFRDAQVFHDLRRKVLPALPRRAGHPRIWSVGCSDGQELYSVAMLLQDQGRLNGATLLGTDCRAAAVARAREGRYDAAAIRDVPPSAAAAYFVNDGATWRVRDDLRAATQWRSGDATRLSEPGAWDLILCRNVSMYLRTESAAQLRLLCEQALGSGGVLVFGKAERPTGVTRLVQLAPCIYRKE